MVTETQGNETSTESTASGAESSQASMPDSPENAEKSHDVPVTAANQPVAAAAIQNAYSPNYKFKVLNQEKEFDPFLKDVIKDVETEKKVRELYEKAYGLDFVKEDRHKVREENSQLRGNLDQAVGTITQANNFLAKKDYDGLFGMLKIPEDDVLAQAIKILKIREMPADQRMAYEQGMQAKQHAQTLEQQNQQWQQSYQQVAVTARTQELNWTLQKPEISAAASQFDARMGPGKFQEAVIQRGQYHAYHYGRDISPEQAAQEVISYFGGQPGMQQAQQPAQTFQQQSQAPQQPVMPEKKPVITNIAGRSTSPTKKMVKSVADIRKRYNEVSNSARGDE